MRRKVGRLTNRLRQMGLNDAQIAATTCHGKPLAEVEQTSKRSWKMNKTEQAYAWILESEIRGGQIVRWEYEAVKLRLADRTWYTPDFCVWYPDGRVGFREVKGGRVRDDAAVKFKVAREMYPGCEWQCWQLKKGEWRGLFWGSAIAKRKKRETNTTEASI